MRIGIIQTRGIGDIVIALPIAQFMISNGHEVYWPIDSRFLSFFKEAAPEVTFLPVDAAETGDQTQTYFYDAPMAMLTDASCDPIFSLYSFLSNRAIVNEKLSKALKFDEYKYAVAGVPFHCKWSLRLKRNPDRERELYKSLDINGPYILVHSTASKAKVNVDLAPQLVAGRQIVHVTERTDNPFDWLYALQQASLLVMIDSFFANLVEQLNFPNPKILLIKTEEVHFNPVYKNGWIFN